MAPLVGTVIGSVVEPEPLSGWVTMGTVAVAVFAVVFPLEYKENIRDLMG